MNRVVVIPLATIDKIFRPRDLPVGAYLRNYFIKEDALHLEWISLDSNKEKAE